MDARSRTMNRRSFAGALDGGGMAAGIGIADAQEKRPEFTGTLAKDDITLAEILGRAGFTTGFIVDTFHYFKPDMNFHRGFNSWEWIRGQESDAFSSGPRRSVRPDDYAPAHLMNDYYRERIVTGYGDYNAVHT